MYLYVKISQIVLMRNGTDAWDTINRTNCQNGPLQFVARCCRLDRTYGSAIRRSVSFTILFGKAAMPAQTIPRCLSDIGY